MKIVSLTPELLSQIEWQEAQVSERSLHQPAQLLKGECYAGVEGDQVIFVAGVINGYQAWAVLSKHAHKYLLPITRIIRRWFSLRSLSFVEIVVRPDFMQAHRWAAMLGFKQAEYSEELDAIVYVRN